MVVFGREKLDEISSCGPTMICEFRDGSYETYDICPEDFGLRSCVPEDLAGGTPEENAQITMNILHGRERGAKRTAVLLNAGAVLYLDGKTRSFHDGISLAAELIDSRKAADTLTKFIHYSNL